MDQKTVLSGSCDLIQWSWKKYVPPECLYQHTRAHSDIQRKTTKINFAAVKTTIYRERKFIFKAEENNTAKGIYNGIWLHEMVFFGRFTLSDFQYSTLIVNCLQKESTYYGGPLRKRLIQSLSIRRFRLPEVGFRNVVLHWKLDDG
jgi:hypothetical protein